MALESIALPTIRTQGTTPGPNTTNPQYDTEDITQIVPWAEFRVSWWRGSNRRSAGRFSRHQIDVDWRIWCAPVVGKLSTYLDFPPEWLLSSLMLE
ncbi:hypothetical protein BO78DRAFT_399367 [Aspergillus sclerotiicarbonarius CBS 121057]|uniref:Uncharacterized protein n=1 Tax=Aspergillus sclerotiicarbonarius (strain CBS 121057 / IBT 28362) TaxID=1448318 RepID=A0A319EBY9_ASPSB|nr:hypothetical protein BO78DRAFT_399367 [Aspergillus sclerotiicarbonarius CBS 121057]